MAGQKSTHRVCTTCTSFSQEHREFKRSTASMPTTFRGFRDVEKRVFRQRAGEMGGGTVSESSPGKGQGSTFKVTLPATSMSRLAHTKSRAPEPKHPIEGRPAAACQKLNGVRVLLVED